MDSEDFDHLDLPKTSANEDLETLSRTKLLLLVPVELFELRAENQRDKGIDFVGELKRKSSYTNFRFAIQLKATQTKSYNLDNSVSFAIDVSNINYLMNNGMPAYYVLYEKNQDRFFYAHANDVYADVLKKYSLNELPDKFSVRFDKPLTPDVLKTLHEDIFQRGILLRNLNNVLQVNLQQDKLTTRIVIDEHQNVYTKEQKIDYIEKYGFALLNKRQFKKIADIEQHCYPIVNASASFHFICGMAFYHQSNMFKALDHFKSAAKLRDQLNKELQTMLVYYCEMGKFSLGMINSNKIRSVIDSMKENGYLSLYLRVERAFQLYSEDMGDEESSLKRFFDEMSAIKHDPLCDESMGMIVNSQILLVNGYDVNLKVTQLLHRAKLNSIQTAIEQTAIQHLIEWYDERAQSLQKLALEQGNLLTYYIISLNFIRTKYKYIVLMNYITNYDEGMNLADFDIQQSDQALIDYYITVLDEIVTYYKKESFSENLTVALSIKYELLHFLGRKNEASIISSEILTVIEGNDLNSLADNYQFLINGGTTHEKVLNQVQETFASVSVLKNEADDLRKKLQEIEDQEQGSVKNHSEESNQIQLIPLGVFAFPKDKLSLVLELINASEEAANQIKHMFTLGVIPIANVFNVTVDVEGPGRGILDFKGLSSERNLYRIRASLSKNGIYRVG